MGKEAISQVLSDLKHKKYCLYLAKKSSAERKKYLSNILYMQGKYYASMNFPINATDNEDFRRGYEEIRLLKK